MIIIHKITLIIIRGIVVEGRLLLTNNKKTLCSKDQATKGHKPSTQTKTKHQIKINNFKVVSNLTLQTTVDLKTQTI